MERWKHSNNTFKHVESYAINPAARGILSFPMGFNVVPMSSKMKSDITVTSSNAYYMEETYDCEACKKNITQPNQMIYGK